MCFLILNDYVITRTQKNLLYVFLSRTLYLQRAQGVERIKPGEDPRNRNVDRIGDGIDIISGIRDRNMLCSRPVDGAQILRRSSQRSNAQFLKGFGRNVSSTGVHTKILQLWLR